MTLDEHTGFALIAAAAAGVIAYGLGRMYWARRIRRWCRDHHFRLLDWYGARFYEGPEWFIRGDAQRVFHILVVDRDGLERNGYLVFGHRWWPFSRAVEVHWEGTF